MDNSNKVFSTLRKNEMLKQKVLQFMKTIFISLNFVLL
jgi:hypothetical protein